MKFFISFPFNGHGTLQEKIPIPFFSGSMIPILSKASIVSVQAFPTAIIPRFLSFGFLRILLILFWKIKFFEAGNLLVNKVSSLSRADSCFWIWTFSIFKRFLNFGLNDVKSTTALESAVSAVIFNPTQIPAYLDNWYAWSPKGTTSWTLAG